MTESKIDSLDASLGDLASVIKEFSKEMKLEREARSELFDKEAQARDELAKRLDKVKEDTKALPIVQKLVFGSSGIALTALVTALVYLVVQA